MNSELMSTVGNKKIVIVIPCRNEEVTVQKVVTDFRQELPQAEIVVVNSGSTDQTVDLARQVGAKIIHIGKLGKGRAVRAAFTTLDFDRYVLVDGDDTYLARDVHVLLEAVTEGRADLVVGDRRHKGNREIWIGHRKLGNLLFCSILNILFRSRFKDILSGYRVMTRAVAKKAAQCVSDGFEIETEMMIQAVKNRFRVKEIPIGYNKRPQGSNSKLSAVRDGLKIIFTMLWMRLGR